VRVGGAQNLKKKDYGRFRSNIVWNGDQPFGDGLVVVVHDWYVPERLKCPNLM